MSKDNKKKIADFGKALGIEYIGVCDAEPDFSLLSILEKRRNDGAECEFTHEDLLLRVSPKLVLEGAQSVVVCLFPYYKSDYKKDSNISRYASLKDYHQVALDKLRKIADYIKSEVSECSCLCFSDTGVLNDRFLAYKAGLGFFGKNNCLINEKLGSYFFIGYIVTTCKITPDSPVFTKCLGCNECILRCPSNALSDGFGFKPLKCISYITQSKEISDSQKKALENQKSVYGCDVCQEVCPHNAHLSDTCLPDFEEEQIDELSFFELSQMSNRQFKNKYKNFAFSWRGKDVILKNFVGGTYVKQRKDNG